MLETAQIQPPARLRRPHGAASVHLDALRGIAAVGVCLSHLRDVFFRDYPQVAHHSLLLALAYLATGLGHQWVIVFFVLSGYLVGGSVLRAYASGRWAWSDYLFNRLTRLYIVLVPALVLGGLIDIAGIHLFGPHSIYGGKVGSHTIIVAVHGRLGLTTLLGNYAFLQTILVPTFGSNGPLWSLANEFWYYVAFPALVFVVMPRSTTLRRFLYLILLVAVVLLVKQQIAFLGIVWLMGVVIHYLPRIPAERAVSRRLFIAVALIIFAGTLAWCKQTRFLFSDFVLGAVVMLLIYVVLGCSRARMPALYTRTAQRLSHSSYTLYLVHVPLLVFLAGFLEIFFGQSRWIPDARHLLFGAGLFLLSILYSQLIWFFFEKRTDGLRTWLKLRLEFGQTRPAAVPGRPQ